MSEWLWGTALRSIAECGKERADLRAENERLRGLLREFFEPIDEQERNHWSWDYPPLGGPKLDDLLDRTRAALA